MDGEHQSATAGGWGPVYSELLPFDNPSIRLPTIDRLGGFHPGGSNMYQRVMVVAQVETAIMPVWLYSMKYQSDWKRVTNDRCERTQTYLCRLILTKSLDNRPMLIYFRFWFKIWRVVRSFLVFAFGECGY